MVHELTDYLSRALITSHNKTDYLRAYVLLGAAIYFIDSTVKKSNFELTASLVCGYLIVQLRIYWDSYWYLEFSANVKFPHTNYVARSELSEDLL